VPVRVGTDLVSVEAVRSALERHADRYLTRVYTEREVADCQGADGVEPERLAARFAAKEAALKVLRHGGEGVPWPAIELVKNTAGWVELALHGRAAELAEEAGISGFSVSVTHEGGFALAVVVAEVIGGS
jgi:holo-[acyl-carrier protein] synthase